MKDGFDFKELIPHKPPFLLLDDVTAIEEDHIRAFFRLDGNHRLFQQVYAGHYPDNPVTPGVLLCEMVFQAAAVLISYRLTEETKGVPVLVKISDARFKQIIRPGDEVEITSTFIEQVSNAFYMKGTVRKNGKTAVRVQFTCALVPEEEGGQA